jgi:hypothetical protein
MLDGVEERATKGCQSPMNSRAKEGYDRFHNHLRLLPGRVFLHGLFVPLARMVMARICLLYYYQPLVVARERLLIVRKIHSLLANDFIPNL